MNTELSTSMTFEEARDLVAAYKRVFSTKQGRKVLGHMLFELHFFNPDVSGDGEAALRNYATALLTRLCGYDHNVFLKHTTGIPGAVLNEDALKEMKSGVHGTGGMYGHLTNKTEV